MVLLSQTTIQAEQIPIALTPMIGRNDETALLLDLLTNSSTRIVTISGPSGVGKTRLALHIASLIGEQGVSRPVFISLGLLRIPDLILQAVGTAIGVRSPTTGSEYEALVREELSHTETLLILDNLEHVRTVAPALSRLVQAVPNLRILATSQVPLNCEEESVLHLTTLETPKEDESDIVTLLKAPSVQLFIDRAQGVNPQFRVQGQEHVIAEVCRFLNGLPLAIELAAARTNIFTPQAMLARLHESLDILSSERIDLPPRQRTMRAAIGWSYDLLTSDEQFLFRRLSPFAGGFAIEAVEIIAPQSGSDRSPYDVLGSLVNHSLVQTVAREDAATRYHMLETVRSYGLEELEHHNEVDAASLQHAQIMTRLVEQMESGIIGPDQEVSMRRLDDSMDNIRLAIMWSLEHKHEQIVLKICGAIWRYLSARGLAKYSLRWIEQALDQVGEVPPLMRAKALLAGGFLSLDLRDWEKSQAMFERTRHLSAAIGATALEIRALIGLGSIAMNKTDHQTAEELHLEAGALARASADNRALAIALGNLASLSFMRGSLERAAAKTVESIEILEQLGDTAAIAQASSNIGAIYIELGKWELAESYLLRALEWQRRINDMRDLPYTLINVSEVARQLGDSTFARDSLLEAMEIAQQSGSTLMEGAAIVNLASFALWQGDTAEAIGYLQQCLEGISGSSDAPVIIESIHQMIRVCADQQRHADVLELAAADAAIRKTLNMPKTARMQTETSALINIAEGLIPPTEADALRSRGAARGINDVSRWMLSLARATAYQLESTPSPSPVSNPATVPVISTLTPREMEILHMLAQGKSTRQIADALFISPRTVATHVASILKKIDVPNRTAAVAWALRFGLT